MVEPPEGAPGGGLGTVPGVVDVVVGVVFVVEVFVGAVFVVDVLLGVVVVDVGVVAVGASGVELSSGDRALSAAPGPPRLLGPVSGTGLTSR